MVMPQHICPFGIRSKDLLEREGFDIEDHHLTSRAETKRFQQKHQVSTTPQTFIQGVRIGGFDDLARHFGKRTFKQEGTTYQPIIAIFSTTILMAIASAYSNPNKPFFVNSLQLFIAFSMCFLGIMKLRDVYSFANQFLGYDLLAQRWVPYTYVYPLIETISGICMVGGVFIELAAPASLMIGLVGAISVIQAVYIDRRELKCACVGGNSNVPLGFVSLTENLMMVFMGIWMLVR